MRLVWRHPIQAIPERQSQLAGERVKGLADASKMRFQKRRNGVGCRIVREEHHVRPV